MTLAKIPEGQVVLLIRAFGLLVSQAGIYGPVHNVTKSVARSVFEEFDQAIRKHGPIEISLREQQVQINGSPDGITPAISKSLVDRMLLHKLNGLLFLSPPDLGDFMRCVVFLGQSPCELAEAGGFEGAVRNAALKSVRVIKVAYQRVAEGTPQPAPTTSEQTVAKPLASVPPRHSPGAPMGVLDLSFAMGDADDGMEADFGVSGQSAEQVPNESGSNLVSLLRDVAAILERGGAFPNGLPQDVVGTLNRVRSALADMAVNSEHHISALAGQVDEDRQTIASIEHAARRRGIGLKLTRSDLIRRYAELNQEVLQPLTVSTGVIDLLSSGSAGTLTGAQRELLNMAAESVARVNQLVACMNRISGLPDSLTPDADVIADTYRGD